jgi:tetratricopeptide (TPR) repeat protein
MRLQSGVSRPRFRICFFLAACAVSWSCHRSGPADLESVTSEVRLSKQLNDAGKIEESLTHLEAVINSPFAARSADSLPVPLPELLKVAGQDCYYLRRYNQALRYLKKAAGAIANPAIHVDTALCHLAKRDANGFAAEIALFESQNTNPVLAQQIKGLAFYAKLAGDPKVSPGAIFKAGWNLGGMNNNLGAYALTTLALERGFDPARCYYQRGVAAAGIGKTGIALFDFTKAIALKRDYQDAYFERAGVYMQADKIPEAESDLRAVLKLNPASYDSHFMLGEIYRDQRKSDQAMGEYKAAWELSGKAVEGEQGGVQLVAPPSRMFRAQRFHAMAGQRMQELGAPESAR